MIFYYKNRLLPYLLAALITLNACGIYKKVDTRKTPVVGEERARKNLKEGKGLSIGGLRGGGATNYEFSTSNPMWRATLEILDTIPLTTVDYSGGIIITDWYADNASKANESIKMTVRFLSNEIQTNSLKVNVHKKICTTQNNCNVKLVDSRIKEVLTTEILKKAAVLKKQAKTKKKK